MNYYNENDAYAAEWLRNLIKGGQIAYGDVDERSVEDVHPQDLKDYTQCHFFAGIGVWSLALWDAGWPDDRPVWTGSCPCQPFSAAGKRGGTADERHLWPAWYHLIRECRPDVVFGEQVASKDGLGWLDLVQTDMEAEGYAFGAVDTCAAGFGAPHIRQRLYFTGQRVGDTERAGLEGHTRDGDGAPGRAIKGGPITETSGVGGVEHTQHQHQQPTRQFEAGLRDILGTSEISRLANTSMRGREPIKDERSTGLLGKVLQPERPGDQSGDMGTTSGGAPATGPTNGYWRDADWLYCRDGKWRAVEPGTFPLAHGATSRVGRLRAYGNAICAQAAQKFIEAVM